MAREYNPFKYVAKKNSPSFNLQGVYYKDGYIISSNGFVLVIKKYPYDHRTKEGKILDKDGKIIPRVYAEYGKIIPRVYAEYGKVQANILSQTNKMHKYTINLKDYKKWLKDNDEKIKCSVYLDCLVKIGKCFFTVDKFNLFIKALKDIDMVDFMVDDEEGKIPAYSLNQMTTDFSCIMPSRIKETELENKIIYEIKDKYEED